MVPPWSEAYAAAHGQTIEYDDAPASAPDGVFRPDIDMPELFSAVAGQRDPTVFPDGKRIPDCTPRGMLQEVSAAYAVAAAQPDFNPTHFWLTHFISPDTSVPEISYEDGEPTLDAYITRMWSELSYHAPQDRGTLLGTPNVHLKPGERFAEGYYWDLADAISGLLAEARSDNDLERHKKEQLVNGVAANIASQIQRFGYAPNGQRTYYLGRSQPPVFVGILKEMAAYYGDRWPNIKQEYRPIVEREYHWFMQGEAVASMKNGTSMQARVIHLPDGTMLNRHWDFNATPRAESFQEDIETARKRPDIDPRTVFRHLRAGAESGKDFTARFLSDPERLETIHAADFITPELNSMLWEYEDFLAQTHEEAGNSSRAVEYRERADRRLAAMNTYLWNEAEGYFGDYNFADDEQSGIKSMAMAYPVARGLASPEQARRTAAVMGRDLLMRGGFVSALVESEQQWDSPNGFPRDQKEGVQALLKSGHDWLAHQAINNWLSRDQAVFERLGVLVEKNNVVDAEALPGAGGEYPVQRGFLWTNGVHRWMQLQARLLLVV